MLHGRNSFDISEGERWLKGTYVDMQDFNSTLRRTAQDLNENAPSSKAGSTITETVQPDSDPDNATSPAEIDLLEEVNAWKEESGTNERTQTPDEQSGVVEAEEQETGFRSSVMKRGSSDA